MDHAIKIYRIVQACSKNIKRSHGIKYFAFTKGKLGRKNQRKDLRTQTRWIKNSKIRRPRLQQEEARSEEKLPAARVNKLLQTAKTHSEMRWFFAPKGPHEIHLKHVVHARLNWKWHVGYISFCVCVCHPCAWVVNRLHKFSHSSSKWWACSAPCKLVWPIQHCPHMWISFQIQSFTSSNSSCLWHIVWSLSVLSSSPRFLWWRHNLWKMFLMIVSTCIESPSGCGPAVKSNKTTLACWIWFACAHLSTARVWFWSRRRFSNKAVVSPGGIAGSLVGFSSSAASCPTLVSIVASVVSGLFLTFHTTRLGRSCATICDLCPRFSDWCLMKPPSSMSP